MKVDNLIRLATRTLSYATCPKDILKRKRYTRKHGGYGSKLMKRPLPKPILRKTQIVYVKTSKISTGTFEAPL